MLGFLCVYKPSGLTSNAVVQKIKKAFHIDKIGHMGTLDPLACGVLPIAIGKATRLFDYTLEKTKSYTAIFDFGYTTDSLDTTGNITCSDGRVPTEDEIKDILPKLIGKISQIPPQFSAKNVNGKKAYTLARSGVDFDLKPKDVTIFDIKLVSKVDENRYKFEISCSSGTYIRAIARDMAKLLGSQACMSFLERTSSGNFKIEQSHGLDVIINSKDLNDFLIPVTSVFDFPIEDIDLSTFSSLIDGKKVIYKSFSKPTFIRFNGKIVGIAKTNLKELKLETFLFEK